MSERDLFFLVLILIGISALTIVVVQFVRSRRGGRGHRGNWWEGPWDEDERR